MPWGQIDIGETVLLKLARGPIVARARVDGFRVFENCDVETLRRATVGYGLHALESYWDQIPKRFFGMAVFVGAQEWLDDPYAPNARSRGASWIVAKGPDRSAWEIVEPAPPEVANVSGRASRRGIAPRLRFVVLRRDGFACTYCGRRAQEDGVVLHIDHIVPVREGGPTVLENLRTACRTCNLGKGGDSLT